MGVKFRKRSGAVAAPWETLLKANGCTVAQSNATATTIATYTNYNTIILTADRGAIGGAALIELNSGLYYPALVAGYNAGTATLSMNLPTASQAGQDFIPMYTAIPNLGELDATDTISIREHTLETHTSGNDMAYLHSGCAVESFGPLVFENGKSPDLSCSIHVCKTAQYADSIVDTEDICDGEQYLMINDNCSFGYNTANSAGAIAYNAIKVHKVDFDPGVKVIGLNAIGSGVCGNTGAFLSDYTGATVKLTMAMTRALFTEHETAAKTAKYIHVVQPSSGYPDTPAFGLWMPQAYQTDCKRLSATGGWVECELTFRLSSAKYGTDESHTYAGMAPWFFAIG
jgi:hypothetical protein